MDKSVTITAFGPLLITKVGGKNFETALLIPKYLRIQLVSFNIFVHSQNHHC